jgi:hypothetical protein
MLSVEVSPTKMTHLLIIFTIFSVFFHPTFPQMKTYIKVDRFLCNFSMEYYFENASCESYSIDRDTKLISTYVMNRKTINDISVLQIFYNLNLDASDKAKSA